MFASPAEQSARASMARIFGESSGSAAFRPAAAAVSATPLKEVIESTVATFNFDPGHAWERFTDNIDIKWFMPSSTDAAAAHYDDGSWMSRAHRAMAQYAPNMPSNVHAWYTQMQLFVANHWKVVLAVSAFIMLMLLVIGFKIAKRIIAYIRARRAKTLHLVSAPALAAGAAVMAAAASSSSSSPKMQQHEKMAAMMSPSMWSRFCTHVGNMTNRIAVRSFMSRVKARAMKMASKATALISRWTPSWLVMIGVQIVMFWLRVVIALSNLWYRCKCFLTRNKSKTIHMPGAHDMSEARAHIAQHDSTARSIMQADMLSYQKMDELRASVATIYFTAAAQLKQDGKLEAASILEQSCHELLRPSGGGGVSAT